MTSLSRALTSMTGLLSGTWTDHCLLAPHGAKQQEVRQVEQQMYGVSTKSKQQSLQLSFSLKETFLSEILRALPISKLSSLKMRSLRRQKRPQQIPK